jgi:FMN phosphatase YigB (HAD superfamily)
MIKLVIFDLGKVLVDFDFKIAIKRLQKICPVNLFKVHSLFTNSPLTENWDKGLISESEFYHTVRSELDIPLEIHEFIPIWNEIFTEKQEMIELAKVIAAKKNVIILSNTNPWHVGYLKNRYPWLNCFHGFIASCARWG